jgi:hypothetical protein
LKRGGPKGLDESTFGDVMGHLETLWDDDRRESSEWLADQSMTDSTWSILCNPSKRKRGMDP